MKEVFIVRVMTKDMISDFFARMKSLIGGRIKSYEILIQETLEEMYNELIKKYPNIQNIKIATTEMIKDGAELIMYGQTE
jgi:uncharacterized protein YbjQ (UPF0145 family)